MSRNGRDVDVALDETMHDASGASGAGPGDPWAAANLRSVLAGRYEIASLLGVGGMGAVYRAHDRELGEAVALKMLHPELVGSPSALERFRAEVRLARKVTHRNVARTFDLGEDGALRFLTMELVDGRSLADVIAGAEGRALPIETVVRTGLAIAAGLGAAHEAGVVHRDLKPANVLVASGGRVVVTDFGIARAVAGASHGGTGPLEIVGTPAYMAPEQIDGSRVDPRTDVYALGLVLFEMLTGRWAFTGATPIALAAMRLTQVPPDVRELRPEVPEALATLVARCLSRAPDARPADGSAVDQALTSLGFGAARSLPPTAPKAARGAHAPPQRGVASEVLPRGSRDRRALVMVLGSDALADGDRSLAEGLAEDLVDALSAAGGLRARASTEHDVDPAELGRRLGVDVVVPLQLARIGAADVGIRARVVSCDDGLQIWAKRWQRPLGEALSIVDEVAQGVAAAVTREAGAPRAVSAPPEAIELYLRARGLAAGVLTPGLEEARELLERAVALAPEEPVILAQLAIVSARSLALLRARPGSAQIALALAERALQLGPHLGEPYIAHAHIASQHGDVRHAMELASLALARAPGMAEAHDFVGRIAVEVDLLDEAERHLERALWVAPDLPFPRVDLARLHAFRGDHARCEAELAKLREHAPYHHSMVAPRMRAWRGERIEDYATDLRGDPLPLAAAQAYRAFLRGEGVPAQPREALARAMGASSPRIRWLLAQVQAELAMLAGADDAALDWIVRGVGEGLVDLAWMDRAPVLARLRARPAFAPLRARVAERAARIVAAYAPP